METNYYIIIDYSRVYIGVIVGGKGTYCRGILKCSLLFSSGTPDLKLHMAARGIHAKRPASSGHCGHKLTDGKEYGNVFPM